MLSFSTILNCNDPESLFVQCLSYICKNPQKVFVESRVGYEFKHEGTVLPDEIADALFRGSQEYGTFNDKFAQLFANTKNTRLKRLNFWNSPVTNAGLESVLKHHVEELSMGYCDALDSNTLEMINKYGENFRTLRFDYNTPVLEGIPDDLELKYFDITYYKKRKRIFDTPKLRHLTLKKCIVDSGTDFYSTLAFSLPQLTYLDLSSSEMIPENLAYLSHLRCLESLILHDVRSVQKGIHYICRMLQLRHLDISQLDEEYGTYDDGDKVLNYIVKSLPNLDSLDISGTNLAGKGVFSNNNNDMEVDAQSFHSDIFGLASRTKNPLQFLGLYGTRFGASHRHDIPAIEIAGEANEQQLINAGRRYLYRPTLVQKILNDLFHYLRYETPGNPDDIVRVILDSLNTYPYDKTIQIAGNASLFYVVKNKEYLSLSYCQRKCIIETLMRRMTYHESEETIIRNGLLILCQFYVPKDFLFIYDMLVSFLLKLINNRKMDGFIHRVSMYLLNSLACQVDDTQKHVLGELNVIENMLELIRTRVTLELCDDIMEIAWSTMWNVTDETPVNCKRFLDSNGMDCFKDCLQLFPAKNELMRNMMGLLGNVAEVKDLRPRLMDYSTTFYDLLLSVQDGIEVSYNAAGVIAHLASDGPDCWTNRQIGRKEILDRMVACIECWYILSERNINYRSFKPILQLARCEHTVECQHWAVWALANLTSVYPNKYCEILEAENGLPILTKITRSETMYKRVKELALIVISNCINYRMSK